MLEHAPLACMHVCIQLTHACAYVYPLDTEALALLAANHAFARRAAAAAECLEKVYGMLEHAPHARSLTDHMLVAR